MTKEEARNNMVDYYTRYLAVAQGIVRAGSFGEKDLNLTPQALTEIIQHTLAIGLVIGGFDIIVPDERVAATAAREYFNIYLDQVSQFIQIDVNA